jgi:hypothetical protein
MSSVEEKTKQRSSFLLEVYKRTNGDEQESIAYEEIKQGLILQMI